MKAPRKKAVALTYSDDDSAPRVVAKGSGILADSIIEKAKSSGVPLYEDSALAAILSELEIEREIPPELFKAVAEVLAWIYKANGGL